MIHFIIATHTEAKMFIEFYNLKKDLSINEFSIFRSKNNDISITISGIGKIASACAVIFTYYYYQKKNSIWINLGIAGHKDSFIGDFYLINKILDYASNNKYYPLFIQETKIKCLECITFDKPNFDYTNKIHDMELSGFYYAASKFSTNELIHSFKIISDNEKKKISYKNKKEVENLMKKIIFQVDGYIKQLNNLKIKV